MESHGKHGNITYAAFIQKPCFDFKKFIEEAVDHRDAGYHRKTTKAAKAWNRIKIFSIKSSFCICLNVSGRQHLNSQAPATHRSIDFAGFGFASDCHSASAYLAQGPDQSSYCYRLMKIS
ncbi:unnamed protein product [Clavelina lepadiformis]|uniref:Uncharacterized protein n=1 Tax=Clavelina lepadiformis TaxID=159417 RepID=A0ABP0FZI8_CLALP